MVRTVATAEGYAVIYDPVARQRPFRLASEAPFVQRTTEEGP